MNSNGRLWEAEDFNRFDENRRKVPPEQLRPFAGLHVAWSLDGTHIVASAADRQTLHEQLLRAGLRPNQIVHDYIEDL